ncbi:aminotransferase class III-fold pyridoxal phosphate-dependent enzyme [Arcanobacterium haemolyticum]|uniref:Aminotransferase class-III n=1 Tax=Arcanobacterium haemolyticum (strain ATCC 9345 / DSM 20595 / CCM 5947 / CCUG 17215 / LMG 16163 / NBRC 15585 / NCTC 8452 / 11018) TaxID=644284 RepID=D7BP27_ARCHD|nr:aminotransferase class III-fold pyridoxal phosphate-dependent enzyme [Arcanobacterium haemolyticum]ADH92676.1 aminotransferase class-III [Arcanobacterium haemolyticum DSM 20595]QCX46786.1 aminotransferase class III-fold pyridoxal phosphate-dependent enzyme [Arcanobacterium haemolyticum]SPT74811.1 Acetylornithine aminotransferase [Arcanobacterium haemolyticum]SQH28587.1 Acetylornithine aminotransferase [Arcanobacterium haemolyticum]
MSDLIPRYDQSMMAAYGLPPLVLTRGEGVTVWDSEGRSYLDLDSGGGVTSLGHNHPQLRSALLAQAEKICHVSNSFATEPQVALAERLQQCLSDEGYLGATARVFFSNSGSEAMEAALKMARLHKPRGRILTLNRSYHGRTMGALSLADEAYRAPFEPLLSGVQVVQNAAELESAFDDDVAACVIDVHHGRSIERLNDHELGRVRDLCDRFRALLIVDESLSAVGRTGRWFAHTPRVVADVITVARGLGGGVPIGVTIGFQTAGRLVQRGLEASSTGGNPLATAAGLCVLNTVEPLLPHVVRTGAWLKAQLEALAYEVQGEGLMLAVAVPDAADYERRLREKGFLVSSTSGEQIRLLPPLIITRDDLRPFIAAMAELKEYA